MARKESAARASQKVGGFVTAKKNIVVQYDGRDASVSNMLTLIRKDALAKGAKDEEIDLVDVYIKPQEQAVYYVVNKEISGRIDF